MVEHLFEAQGVDSSNLSCPTLILRVGLEEVPAQSHKLNDVSSSLTPATKRVVRIELLRSIGSNPILPTLDN